MRVIKRSADPSQIQEWLQILQWKERHCDSFQGFEIEIQVIQVIQVISKLETN